MPYDRVDALLSGSVPAAAVWGAPTTYLVEQLGCRKILDTTFMAGFMFGPVERVVFLPYTADAYERAQQWMRERDLFDVVSAPPAYESVVHV